MTKQQQRTAIQHVQAALMAAMVNTTQYSGATLTQFEKHPLGKPHPRLSGYHNRPGRLFYLESHDHSKHFEQLLRLIARSLGRSWKGWPPVISYLGKVGVELYQGIHATYFEVGIDDVIFITPAWDNEGGKAEQLFTFLRYLYPDAGKRKPGAKVNAKDWPGVRESLQETVKSSPVPGVLKKWVDGHANSAPIFKGNDIVTWDLERIGAVLPPELKLFEMGEPLLIVDSATTTEVVCTCGMGYATPLGFHLDGWCNLKLIEARGHHQTVEVEISGRRREIAAHYLKLYQP